MINYQAGMIVRQRAINWWPYLETIIKRVNEAAETKNIEALDETILDAAKLVEDHRRVATVNELEGPLKKQLDHSIWLYRSELKEAMSKKRRLRNPIGKNGMPLKASTIQNYRYVVGSWPRKRESLKKDIRAAADELKALTPQGKKLFNRGDVSLKLIYGGNYPAKLEKKFQQGWRQIR